MVNKKFKTFNIGTQEYRFHNILFLFSTLILSLIVLLTAIDYSQQKVHYYVECHDTMCFNEYFNSPSCGKQFPIDAKICTKEYFYNGEIDGVKPTPLQENFGLLTSGLIILTVILNHIFFNRKFKFSEVD